MRIAQISDFHFTHLTWNPLRLFSKRLFGNLNWLFSRKNAFSTEQLIPLPSLLSSLNTDLILLGGDFTTTSLPKEFEEAKAFIDKLPSPIFPIPGNHDHYTARAFATKRYYHYFPNPSLASQQLHIQTLSPDWTLVSLDTILATGFASSRGYFSQELEELLDATLSRLATTRVILFNHYPFFQNDAPKHNLERGEALEELLGRHSCVHLYLHGHTHRHTIADLQSSGLPLILDSGSIADQQIRSWNLIDLTSTGCTVTGYQWQKNQWTPFRHQEVLWTRK